MFTLFGHPCRIALTNPLTERSPPTPTPTLSLAVARGAVGDLAGFSSESPTRLPALCPCRSRRRAPCWGSAVDAARCSARSAGRSACPYLCYRLLVPHGRLFDQVADFYIPISTRNNHPGPPEAHRHFHFSVAERLIPMRKKTRRSDEKHPRSRKVKNSSLVAVRGFGGKVVSSTCVLRGETSEGEALRGSRGRAGCLLRRIDSLKKLPNKKLLRAAGAHNSGGGAALRAHVGTGTDTVSKQRAAENRLLTTHVIESCEIHRLLFL